jgi:protein TonB
MNKFIISISFILVVISHLVFINFFTPNKINQKQQIKNNAVLIQLSKIKINKEFSKEEILTQKKIEKPKNETKKLTQKAKKVQAKEEVIKPLLSKELTKKDIEKNEIQETQEIKELKNSKAQIVEEKEKISKQEQIDREKKYIQNYMYQLREEINKNKNYPIISRKLKEMGKVIISFRVKSDGLFENIKLGTSSNIKRLDEAALNALYETKRFKAFDKDINKEYLDFNIPLEFVVINQ